MYREDPVNGVRRSGWRRWSGLVAMLLIAAPVIARETIVLQKSGTDPQARGEDATLLQASPTATTWETRLPLRLQHGCERTRHS